jgi:hypothetical protein
MRGLAEMAYEFEAPFVLDTAKFESAFGAAGTAAGCGDQGDGHLVPESRECDMTKSETSERI